MSKKQVEIEIIDKELETVTTGGGVLMTQTNNVPNSNFQSALNTSGVGETGCSGTQNYVEYNIDNTGGVPITGNLKPCSYNPASGLGLNTQGICLNFRNTDKPTVSGGSLTFPCTDGGHAATNLVQNGDFSDSLSGNTGFISNHVYVPGAQSHTDKPWGTARVAGAISSIIPPGTDKWYAASTDCVSFPTALYPGQRGYTNSTTGQNNKPFINDSGAFCKLFVPANAEASCAAAEHGTTGIYQVIQGLVAGQEYDLKVKFKSIPSTSDWGFGWGADDLDGGTVYGGQLYTNLGGDTSPIYQGTNAGGVPVNTRTFYGTNIHPMYPILPTTTAEQSTTFIAQGGNEVLSLRYKSYDNTGAFSVLGDDLEIDYIRITLKPQAPLNASTVYGLVTAFDNNAGAVPTSATLKFNMSAGNANDICIAICDQATPSGLQNLITTPMYISNNISAGFWNPTDSFTMGSNSYTIPINGSSSSGSYSANERLFTFTVYNPLGPDPGTGLCPKFDSIDIEYNYTTVPTTYNQINPLKSVVGKLEVSNSEDFPLNISYTVSDGKNLDARFGDYSQTFDLPATANNNRVLNHIWKSTVDQADKKLFGVKDCRVVVNGMPFFDGKIQVKAAEHQGSPKSYSCTLYGGNFSWMSTLKDKNLCEVFDEAETFNFNYGDIEAAMILEQDNTNVQYPLISRKDFNYGPNNPLSLNNYVNLRFTDQYPDWQPAFYVKNIMEKIFSNIGYKIESNFMETNHFKRLLSDFPFLKNDSQDASVKYSTHVTRPHLDMQLLVENVLITGLQTSGPGGDGWHTIKLNQTISDPSNQYDVSTGEWICGLAGVYDVNTANGAAFIQLNGKGSNVSPDNYTFDCKNSSTNARYWNVNTLSGALKQENAWGWAYRVRVTTAAGVVSYLPNGNATPADGWNVAPGNFLPLYPYPSQQLKCFSNANDINGNTHPTASVVLGLGDKIELQVKALGGHNSGSLGNDEPYVDLYTGYDNSWSGSIPPELSIVYAGTEPFVGDTLKFNEILPCDVTQIDFIKSISHLFNLYFTTDVHGKKVYIEPFNEFFKPTSEGLDWNDKVDYSIPIKDDYDIGLKRDLIIKYKTDSADKYAESLNNKSNIWGEENRLYNYKETLGEDYESGEVIMENPLFASTTQVWDNDAHNNPAMDKAPVLIPNLWNEDAPWGITGPNSRWRPSEIIEAFVPRVYYYAWESPVSITYLPSGLVANPLGTQTYWSVQWSVGSDTQNKKRYPRATFVDWEESDHANTQRPSLSFADETFAAPGQQHMNQVPGLYTTYYKNMIEQLKRAPRIRTVSVNLKLSDILNLDIRKLIFLDESWWRINRIVEFSPAKNKPTKVELIQWLDVGYWPVYVDNTLIQYT